MCHPIPLQAIAINEACRKANSRFISCDTFGLFGQIFCDFGDEFMVLDHNGEEPQSAMIASITQDETGLVSVHDESRHGLEDGDYVTFSEVIGMSELNACEPRPVIVMGPYTFTIGDTRGLGKYERGGYVHQVKQKKTLAFKSLAQSLLLPQFLVSDFAKYDRPQQLHLGFQALHAFRAQHGMLPAPSNAAHAAELLQRACELGSAQCQEAPELSHRLIRNLASGSRGEISPLCAFFGGIAAQEVMKAASGKFSPIHQWLYFDAEEVLPGCGEQLLPVEETAPCGTRYDAQAAVLGWSLQAKICSLRYLLVGAGAIGCEMLKNWALMGVGTAADGKIVVTDPDTIEKSNLNRQFLFRPWDVAKPKSQVAAAAVRSMNGAANIEAFLERICPESEGTFDDNFWESLSGVCNALDNVQARLYVDQRCVYYQKSLLESGTLGAKGNVQVVVPCMTESYGSSRDPPEKSIPVCTLKNFPNQIEHTIQWARDLFEGCFKQSADDVNAYLSQPDFLSSLEQQPGVRKGTLEGLRSNLVDKPLSLKDCIVWARLRFEELFHNQIAQLLFNFPLDMVTSNGTPFWSGPKRPPAPLQFNANDSLHIEFIMATANLRAFNYGLTSRLDTDFFKCTLESVMVPEFVPKSGVNIQTDPAKEKQQEAPPLEEEDVCNEIIRSLPPPSSLAGYRMMPVEFEKDDDMNFHIDFINATSNLRARNYQIVEVERHRIKQIAGKIIPAIATTTAMVTGLVCLEMVKLLQPDKKIDHFKNAFANLALPFISFSEPVAAPMKRIGQQGNQWSLWDRYDVDEGRDITLKEFLELFKDRHKLEITMISSGVSILYSFFTNRKKLAERMMLTMSQLVVEVSKIELIPTQRYINFEICCNDDSEDDVEVPYVRYKFRGWT